MKVRHDKINELGNSYINGNKKWVRDEVKKINKAEFDYLVSELVEYFEDTSRYEMITDLI